MKRLYILVAALLAVGLSACHEDDLGFDGGFPELTGGGDQYQEIVENPFVETADEPISAFSIEADGASFVNASRWIFKERQLPPSGAVRTEEFVNYFNLDYPYVDNGHPIDIAGEVSSCPWATDHKLIRIGIQGKPIPASERPPSNYVFLIDVSGSMSGDDRLPLLKTGFKYFVDGLTREDRVSLVTYAGRSRILLESVPGDQKDIILDAIDRLGSGV